MFNTKSTLKFAYITINNFFMLNVLIFFRYTEIICFP
jgi:hypothetical protein